MRNIVIASSFFVAAVWVVIQTDHPVFYILESKREIEIQSDSSFCVQNLKSWSIAFPVPDSLSKLGDMELDGITNMQQVISFAEEEGIHITDPSFESFTRNKRGKHMIRFIFCTDSLVNKRDLEKIVTKAL
jgi:hypothetical protein